MQVLYEHALALKELQIPLQTQETKAWEQNNKWKSSGTFIDVIIVSIRDGREESITRVLLVTNELGWWTGKVEFAYTHINKVF